jgi:hypothetical protein
MSAPPSPLAIAAGHPQTTPIANGPAISPSSSQILHPGSPAIQTPPKTSLYDPRSQPPEDPFIKLIKIPLQQMIGGQIRPSVSMEKIWLNAQMRRAHYYWEGQQYLTMVPNAGFGGVNDYQPLSGSTSLSVASTFNYGQFSDYCLNVYRGDIRKFEAVIGTRSPNPQCQTRDPNDDDQTEIKRTGDRVAAYLRSHWHADDKHRELTHYLALYGNAFSYTRHVADAQKYGTSSIPLYQPVGIPQGEPIYHCLICGQDTPLSQVQSSGQTGGSSGAPQLPLCPRCGNPLGPESLELPETIPGLQLTELMEYENGAVEMDLVNGSMVTFPWWIKSNGANVGHAPWWIYEFELDKGRLARIFPELKSKIYRDTYGLPIEASDATGLSGTQTRRILESPNAMYNYVWGRSQYLYTRVWLPATTLEYLPGDQSGALREQLLGKYPSGILSHYVNGELLRAEPADLGHDWAVCKAEPSDTIYSQPYFHDYIQGQDTINDMLNNLIEAAERSTGAIIFDPQVLDPDRIREYAVQPGEYIPAIAGASGSLADAFFKVPAAGMDAMMWDMIDRYIDKLREVSGIRPEIFGGGNAPTARQAEMNKNQALMQLNTVWNEIRSFWAQTYENGIWHVAKYSQDGRLFQDRGAGQTADMIQVGGVWKLANGGWFISTEEAFPMSVGQRKDFFMNMLELSVQNPILQQDIASPANRSRMAEAIGSPDWRVSGVREREMILRYIAKLSKEAPIQLPAPPPPVPVPDPATGQMTPPPPPEPPPPPQPSQPFNWDLFSTPAIGPDFVVEVIREWATDDSGQELQDTAPQAGWANVMAFLGEAVQKAAPPPPPPPPAKVTYSISSKDVPPDANQAVMEKENLLPPNAPPFSSDPALPKPPPPHLFPGSGPVPGEGPGGPDKSKPSGPPPPKPGGGGTPPPGPGPSNPAAPPNPMATPPPNSGPGIAPGTPTPRPPMMAPPG